MCKRYEHNPIRTGFQMLSSAKGCQLLRLAMGRDRWQLSSQKARTKSSPSAHDRVQDKDLLLSPLPFLLNI